MNRFSSFIDDLRIKRSKLLEESKKRRAKAPAKKRPKVLKEIDFESNMLKDIFAGMPKDMQEHLKGKVGKR